MRHKTPRGHGCCVSGCQTGSSSQLVRRCLTALLWLAATRAAQGFGHHIKLAGEACPMLRQIPLRSSVSEPPFDAKLCSWTQGPVRQPVSSCSLRAWSSGPQPENAKLTCMLQNTHRPASSRRTRSCRASSCATGSLAWTWTCTRTSSWPPTSTRPGRMCAMRSSRTGSTSGCRCASSTSATTTHTVRVHALPTPVYSSCRSAGLPACPALFAAASAVSSCVHLTAARLSAAVLVQVRALHDHDYCFSCR